MALKTLVKVKSIASLADARYAAGMGVEYIGFQCNPEKKNYLSKESIKEIMGWIVGVDFVIEGLDFHNANALAIELGANAIDVRDEIINSNPNELIIFSNIQQTNIDFIQISDDIIDNEKNILYIKDLSQLEAIDYDKIKGIEVNSNGNNLAPGINDLTELADILETLEIED